MVFKTQIIDVKILAAKVQDVVPKLFSSELVEESDLRESLEEAVPLTGWGSNFIGYFSRI